MRLRPLARVGPVSPRRFLERLRSRRIPALGLVLAGAGLALAVVTIATSGGGSSGGAGTESSKSACATERFAGPVRRSARAAATVTDERPLSARFAFREYVSVR